MLTPTEVLREIETRLGASIQILELSEEDIMKIIQQSTIRTFSIYYPLRQTTIIHPKSDKVPERTNVFYIKSDLEIIGVSKVLAENYFGNTGLPMATIDSDPVYRQFTTDLQSMFVQPITFDFESPNLVEIFPKRMLVGDFTLEYKAVHPAHFGTIPLSLREEFLNLATIDVRRALYPIRHRFQNINTAFGNIELFMDKLESAEEDRKDILERWRTNSVKNSKRRKIFVY